MKKKISAVVLFAFLAIGTSLGIFTIDDLVDYGGAYMDLSTVEEYNGKTYVVLNNNVPEFTEEDLKQDVFESYSELDSYGRCGVAYAMLGKELMPREERKSISHIKPTGWQTAEYSDLINERYLYNRCHLIAFGLAGENDNEKNLITGTDYMNKRGMLPFELDVMDYINETYNHVLYRVTPIFEDDELVARGVHMEAYSVEDKGEGICFNIFVYNVQPGIEIDYKTGDNWRADGN